VILLDPKPTYERLGNVLKLIAYVDILFLAVVRPSIEENDVPANQNTSRIGQQAETTF